MTEARAEYSQIPSPLKHSAFGIASFIISLVVGIMEFFLVVISAVLSTGPAGLDEESVVAILLGLFIIGGLIVSLIGAVLGIVGLVQKNRKRIFSVIGLIFNGVIILGVIALMVIGASMP